MIQLRFRSRWELWIDGEMVWRAREWFILTTTEMRMVRLLPNERAIAYLMGRQANADAGCPTLCQHRGHNADVAA